MTVINLAKVILYSSKPRSTTGIITNSKSIAGTQVEKKDTDEGYLYQCLIY